MSDCPNCAKLKKLLIEAEDANAELGRQLAGMELHLRRAGRAEVALRRELSDHREDEPEAKAIREVCEHWKKRLNHERAKTPLTGTRAQKVRARLREKFTVEDLKKAIDGCARKPYVGPGGRKSSGKPADRHDDLELICRDEKHVERFIEIADEPDEPVVTQRAPQPPGPSGVDALLSRLEGVRQARLGQWEARCPAHDDRNASLSVGQGDKGAVVHCHAGCTVEQIAGALGLDVSSLFDPEDAPVPTRAKTRQDPLPDSGELAAMCARLATHPVLLSRLATLRGWTAPTLERLGIGWDDRTKRLVLPVTGRDGTLVNVVRYQPNGKPKTLALAGRPRDLFPAPEWVEGGEVWVVEGEPDAITMAELGIPAVGTPGSNGWRGEWAQRFSGRRVVVCMDCDEPGRKAAERVAQSLTGVAREVRTVDLDPAKADGFDVSDMLRDRPVALDARTHAGLVAQQLRRLAEGSGAVVAMKGRAA